MSDNRDEPMEQPDLAYTAPADAEGDNPFQFHSALTPSGPPVRQKPPKKKGGGVILLAALLFLVAVTAAVALFFLSFQVSVSREDGGLSLSIQRRGQQPLEPGGAVSGASGSGLMQELPQKRQDYQWDGATLRLEPQQQKAGLSWSQIYQERAGSVAIITATDEAGSTQTGSGIVMTADGFLIVSSHVILSARSISARVEGQDYSAYLIGLDNSSDLAVVKIEAEGLTPAEFGQTGQAGDTVAVLGSSLTGSVGISSGLLSAVDGGYRYRGFQMGVFQLYMALGKQASGAALLNEAGQVIGIVNTDIADQYEDSAGVGFAIPTAVAKPIINELLEKGFVAGRPASGLTVSEIPTAYAAYYKYPSCVYVAAINESSTAYEAGVRKGDLILSANGVKIQSVDQLYAVINGMEAGDELRLELYRDREIGILTFPLMEAAQLAG